MGGYSRTNGNFTLSAPRRSVFSFPNRHTAFLIGHADKSPTARTTHSVEKTLIRTNPRPNPSGSFSPILRSPQPYISLHYDNPRTPIQRLPINHITHPPRTFRRRLTHPIHIPQNMRRHRHVPVGQDPFAAGNPSPFRCSILPDRDPRIQMIHIGAVFDDR